MKDVLARLDELGVSPTGLDTKTEREIRNELIERVVRRAEELLQEWSATYSPPKTVSIPALQAHSQTELF
ncbi:MAG: hypothetical protein WA117_04725 [Verrucomicrobiia bacterium]